MIGRRNFFRSLFALPAATAAVAARTNLGAAAYGPHTLTVPTSTLLAAPTARARLPLTPQVEADIIFAALRRLGVIAPGQSPSAAVFVAAKFHLDGMREEPFPWAPGDLTWSASLYSIELARRIGPEYFPTVEGLAMGEHDGAILCECGHLMMRHGHSYSDGLRFQTCTNEDCRLCDVPLEIPKLVLRRADPAIVRRVRAAEEEAAALRAAWRCSNCGRNDCRYPTGKACLIGQQYRAGVMKYPPPTFPEGSFLFEWPADALSCRVEP